jgi:hypothetical protein
MKNCHNCKRNRYLCVARNSMNNRWYSYNDEKVDEVSVE